MLITSDTFEWLALLVIAVAVGVGYLVYCLVHLHHRRHWICVDARIISCDKIGTLDEGSQEYGLTYLFLVDGVRQAGSFSFFDAPERLEELRAAANGKTVSVVYNPKDCTQSVVTENHLEGWRSQR
jgi:hypothetical protein